MELDLQLCYICGRELVKGAEAEHFSSQSYENQTENLEFLRFPLAKVLSSVTPS